MKTFFQRMFCAFISRTSSLYDEKWLVRTVYRCCMHKKLNDLHPQTFNEKLSWMMLYYRNDLYSKLVDKYAVKEWVKKIIGEQYIIPTLGVWNSFDEIDFETLPSSFVLKTTHGGGNLGVVVCPNKEIFDKKNAARILNKSLKCRIYQGEWPYKGVERRIIAEKFMKDDRAKDLKDYKFFCFDGKVNALFVASERGIAKEPYFDFYDANWNHLPFRQGHPNAPYQIAKPQCFEEMKEIAAKLSAGFPHVRVDLYEINGKVFFGELTFFHFGAKVPFEPEEWDYKFGDYMKLPNNKYQID